MIRELNDKIEDLQFKEKRPNLVIHGIIESKEEQCLDVVENFFTNTMGIEQKIKCYDAHRIGKSKNRPMLVKLKYAKQKGLIYSHVSNLQDKTNSNEKPYRVEDQLPPKQAEAKKKTRHLMWRNKKKIPVADKLKASVERGKVMVGGFLLKEAIVAPEAVDLLKLRADETLELLNQQVRRGVTYEHGSSQSTGYVADVANFEDVNKAYEFVRYNNMDARHIMCAAKLPGKDTIKNCGFIDDDEHGGGAKISECLDKTEAEG